MKRIVFLFLCLFLFKPAAWASVLLLQGKVCIERAEILKNENWLITFSQDDRLYKIDAKYIVKVSDARPEDYQSLRASDLPAYIAEQEGKDPRLEASGADQEPAAQATPETPDMSPAPETLAEPGMPVAISLNQPFRIQDVEWVDDADLLWNFLIGGAYETVGDADKNTATPWKTTSRETSLLTPEMNFSWRGYTRPVEWQLNVPFQILMEPQLMARSSQPEAYLASVAGTNGEFSYFPNEVFLGALVDYHGYYNTSVSNNRLQATARIGIGRLYRGRHAYQAMQIIEELQVARKLVKPVTREDMQRLSAILAHARNKYLFDVRGETLEAVDRIASFLLNQGYIKDVRGILIADDIYRYVADIDRNFGARGFIQYRRVYDDGSPLLPDGGLEEQSNQLGLGGDLAFPFSRIWQLNIAAGLDVKLDYLLKKHETMDYYYYDYYYYPYMYSRTTNSTTRAKEINFAPYCSLELYFIPNTRMLLGLSNQLTMSYGTLNARQEAWRNDYTSYYYYYSRKYLDDYDYYRLQCQNNLKIYFDYQISQRLDLEIALNLNYLYESQSRIMGTSQDVSTGLQTEYSAPDIMHQSFENTITIGFNYRLF